jgi:hypothetical protein
MSGLNAWCHGSIAGLSARAILSQPRLALRSRDSHTHLFLAIADFKHQPGAAGFPIAPQEFIPCPKNKKISRKRWRKREAR